MFTATVLDVSPYIKPSAAAPQSKAFTGRSPELVPMCPQVQDLGHM